MTKLYLYAVLTACFATYYLSALMLDTLYRYTPENPSACIWHMVPGVLYSTKPTSYPHTEPLHISSRHLISSLPSFPPTSTLVEIRAWDDLPALVCLFGLLDSIEQHHRATLP